MTTMQLIKNAVEIVGVPVYANNYTGDAKEYCTINTIESPDAYDDDTPGVIRYTVALHWFAPIGNSPADKKRKLTKALLSAGCTYPQITDASDLDSLHFAFECECVDDEAVEMMQICEAYFRDPY